VCCRISYDVLCVCVCVCARAARRLLLQVHLPSRCALRKAIRSHVDAPEDRRGRMSPHSAQQSRQHTLGWPLYQKHSGSLSHTITHDHTHTHSLCRFLTAADSQPAQRLRGRILCYVSEHDLYLYHCTISVVHCHEQHAALYCTLPSKHSTGWRLESDYSACSLGVPVVRLTCVRTLEPFSAQCCACACACTLHISPYCCLTRPRQHLYAVECARPTKGVTSAYLV
jgi:hypothetical protein